MLVCINIARFDSSSTLNINKKSKVELLRVKTPLG